MNALPASFETTRLHLRLPRESDALAIFSAYTQDPEVTRFLVWKPHTEIAEARRFISECMASVNAKTRLPYVLCLRGTPDAPIGMLDAHISGFKASIGYVLAKRYWGNGFMPEAVRAFADVALAQPQFYRVSAFCDVDNRASQRTLEKSGFTLEGRLGRFSVHPNISSEPRDCLMYARCRA